MTDSKLYLVTFECLENCEIENHETAEVFFEDPHEAITFANEFHQNDEAHVYAIRIANETDLRNYDSGE